MRGNQGKETGPEKALRRALRQAGHLGYRKNLKALPGCPDVVFTKRRLAVFVHGCYWHRCPHCSRNLTPSANGDYWAEKFRRNVERDHANVQALEQMGYRVLVVWECQIKRDTTSVVETIGSLLS